MKKLLSVCLILTLAQFVVLFSIMVTVLAQFSDDTVFVKNLILLILQSLLVDVLDLFCHIDLSSLSLCFSFLPLPTPRSDTAYGTATEQKAEDANQ